VQFQFQLGTEGGRFLIGVAGVHNTSLDGENLQAEVPQEPFAGKAET